MTNRLHTTTVVYTTRSKIRQPKKLLKGMYRDLLASRELAWRLLIRDISAKYRQSFLGIFWAFIPPIVTALGLTFARDSGIVRIPDTSLPYAVYVMFGMTLWQTFVEALHGPITAVRSAKNLLVRINFPREAIILAKIGEILFNFGIKLILIIGLFLWFQIPIKWSIVLAPVALLHLICLGIAIGLLLAPLGSLFEDIPKVLSLIMAPWLLLTPVIYPVPEGSFFQKIVVLNPVTPLLVTTRELATGGIISNQTGFWITSIFSITLLIFAWVLYKLSMPYVIERMSS